MLRLRLPVFPSLFYFLLVFTALLYWPGLNGGFLLDDIPNLLPLNDLDTGMASWLDIIVNNESGMLGRPISMLTLVLNHTLNGSDPWSYKYTNLMIHLLSGVMVFWLSYRLLYETRLRDKRYSIALWVMAIWLLTPQQVSTVLYIIQRMAQLSALFVLAGLLSYTTGRQSLNNRPLTGILLILSAFFVWLPLAIFSKENGALMPLLALVIEFYFFKRPSILWQKRFITFIFTITVLIPALLLLAYLVYRPEFIINGYSTRDFTIKERLYSEARILFIYLRSLLIPDSTRMGIVHDDFYKSSGLLDPVTTLISIVAWVMIFSAAWIYRKNEKSIYFFAPVFFIAAHAMESGVFALELYFEHRNYLASYSIYLILAYGLFDLGHRYSKHKLATLFLIFFPTAHIAATYQRVQVWKSPVSIKLNDLYWHPQSVRAHGAIAALRIKSGEYDKALDQINIIFKLNPKIMPEAYILRLVALCGSNSVINDSEYTAFRESLNTPGAYPPTESLRALREYIKNKRCEKLDSPRLIEAYNDWSTQQGNTPHKRKLWISNVHFAQIMFDTGIDKYKNMALRTLKRSMDLVPSYLEAGLLRIRYALILGENKEAWETLQILKRNDNNKRQIFTLSIQNYEEMFSDIRAQDNGTPVKNQMIKNDDKIIPAQ